jgi:hypothetical protein
MPSFSLWFAYAGTGGFINKLVDPGPWTEGGESGQAELRRKRIQIRCPGSPNAVPPRDEVGAARVRHR